MIKMIAAALDPCAFGRAGAPRWPDSSGVDEDAGGNGGGGGGAGAGAGAGPRGRAPGRGCCMFPAGGAPPIRADSGMISVPLRVLAGGGELAGKLGITGR